LTPACRAGANLDACTETQHIGPCARINAPSEAGATAGDASTTGAHDSGGNPGGAEHFKAGRARPAQPAHERRTRRPRRHPQIRLVPAEKHLRKGAALEMFGRKKQAGY